MKRFTETEKWKDPWFRRLDGRMKLLWFWLCDQCDGAGIIDPDMELATFQIGVAVSEMDLTCFDGRLRKIENGKWMLTKFISFQYGELSDACPAHKPVYRSLENNRVLNGYSKGISTLQDKNKDKEKDKDTEKAKDTDPVFERFWLAYPNKKGKGYALQAWKKAISIATPDAIISAVEANKRGVDWLNENGRYIPHPSSWLNAQGWLDEVKKPAPRQY
jgi:hypothetical protein